MHQQHFLNMFAERTGRCGSNYFIYSKKTSISADPHQTHPYSILPITHIYGLVFLTWIMHVYTYTITALNSAQMFSFSRRVDTESVRFFWPLLRMWVEFRYHKYCKLGGRRAWSSFSLHNGSEGSCVCRRVCKCPWIPTGLIDSTWVRLRSKEEKKNQCHILAL